MHQNRYKPENRNSEQPPDTQMVYGIRPVMEAIDQGREFEKIFIGRGVKGDRIVELKALLKSKDISWQEVPVEKLNSLTRKNHQDVICFISPVDFYNLGNLVQGLFEKGLTPFLLLLDRITDVRNFGAIARTAECAGVHAIVIPEKGAAQVSADSIRTSAGALGRIPVCREKNLEKTVRYLQHSGIKVIGATEKGKEYTFNVSLEGPLAIVMGSEEDGISGEILRICDSLVRIPMIGHTASLNVSVACGVILFEALRQRMSSQK
ncbi:MAG: 23S rRNA (guanosine(2251)-2'-O)-methyltransferase RlmB [Bacteroidia bacterium]|nr:23S rRNA (guanosine(2251)-2'-O)-methyltransferase RlmB [Bacteroidia bacterium]